MHTQLSVIIAFALYLGLMMYIGVYYYRKSKNLSDYILGGRQLGPWITSMSAEASDMSGWMLMGLPGFVYSTGISSMWIAIGLAAGTWLNWVFVSKRLRNHTEVANNSLTIPDYLRNRFHDTTRILPVVSAIFIVIFFLIYTSSGFVAGGKLFTTIFGLDYVTSLLITAGVVIFYTFLGGFLAVSWTDFIQGMMMFFAILIVPVTGMMMLHGPINTASLIATQFPKGLSIFGPAKDTFTLVIGVISSVAWGLGYFGQPHILIRFMSIKNHRELVKSRLIALSIGLLNELFKEKWTEDIPGGILESFGRTFQNKTRLYVSPWLNRKSGEFVTARTFRAPEQYVHLYQHFLANELVVDVPFFNEYLLRHTPRDIQRMIAADEDIWKTLVPAEAHRSALHFR